jgi:hypothetical protein
VKTHKKHLQSDFVYDDIYLGRFVHSVCGRGFEWGNATDRERLTNDIKFVTCKGCLRKLKVDMVMNEKNPLYKTALRIIKAGESGKGCRLSAEECRLLLYHNLPCTAEHPSIGFDD